MNHDLSQHLLSRLGQPFWRTATQTLDRQKSGGCSISIIKSNQGVCSGHG